MGTAHRGTARRMTGRQQIIQVKSSCIFSTLNIQNPQTIRHPIAVGRRRAPKLAIKKEQSCAWQYPSVATQSNVMSTISQSALNTSNIGTSSIICDFCKEEKSSGKPEEEVASIKHMACGCCLNNFSPFYLSKGKIYLKIPFKSPRGLPGLTHFEALKTRLWSVFGGQPTPQDRENTCFLLILVF